MLEKHAQDFFLNFEKCGIQKDIFCCTTCKLRFSYNKKLCGTSAYI